jgi:pyridoxal phosphate enzyme (YggS family)
MIEAFLAAGCVDLGESRPQALAEKAEFYASQPVCRSQPIRWHLIGSLQRNKIRKILPVTTLIHSLDSFRLAEAIDRIVREENDQSPTPSVPVHCLLEIAISGDAEKHGFTPQEVPEVVEKIAGLKYLAVDGLMWMSGLGSDERQTRREFAAVRQLAESLRQAGTPPNVKFETLSMGMSGDFELAVEEGATLVRIGSRLYR